MSSGEDFESESDNDVSDDDIDFTIAKRRPRRHGVFQDDDSGDDYYSKKYSSRKSGNSKKSSAVSFVRATTDQADSSEESDPSNDETEQRFEEYLTTARAKDEKGYSNEAFRSMLDPIETEPAPAVVKVSPPAAPVTLHKDFGTWEKHTKGVGLKLLTKMGFTGRLGAGEKGISKPIEAVVRPSGVGFGFGNAEMSKVPEEVQLRTKTEVTTKAETQVISKQWKKDKSRKDRATVFEDTVQQLIDGAGKTSTARAATTHVLDMRFSSEGVLQNVASIGSVSAEPQLLAFGEELIFNLDRIVEDSKSSIENLKLQESRERKRIGIIDEDINRLLLDVKEKCKLLHRTKVVHDVIESLQVDSSNSLGNADGLQSTFAFIYAEYCDIADLYGLCDVFLDAVDKVLAADFGSSWNPLNDPARIMRCAAPLLLLFTDDSILSRSDSDFSKQNFRKQARAGTEQLIEQRCLPAVQRSLATDDWNPSNLTSNDNAVSLLSDLQIVMSSAVFDRLLDAVVFQKLSAFISNFDSATCDPVTLHRIILPWVPVFDSSSLKFSNAGGSKLAELFPEVRRVLRHALKKWKPHDSTALTMLMPWLPYFDAGSTRNWLLQVIVPKLVREIKDMVIDPANQDVKPIEWLLPWKDVISDDLIDRILIGELLPRWLDTLCRWLSRPYANYAEICVWYKGWKELLEPFLESALVCDYFSVALDAMQTALTSGAGQSLILPKTIQLKSDWRNVSFELLQKEFSQNQERSIASAVSRSASVFEEFSTKDALQYSVERSGKTMIPKFGRTAEGKQVWELNDVSFYIDGDVIYVLLKNGEREAVSADRLVSGF